jgi:hypothetical protein
MRLEDMGSTITDNQNMIHVLNNHTSDYDLQLAFIKKRVRDKEKPLTAEEINAGLSLRFERLNMSANENNRGDRLEEHALLSRQFKVKCRNYVQIGHNT